MTDQVEAIMKLVEEYARSKPPILNQDPKRAHYHEEVKAELRRSITELSRHPHPQAVTEDARDGERLDWLDANPCWLQWGDSGWYVTKCGPAMEQIAVGLEVRAAIDAAVKGGE